MQIGRVNEGIKPAIGERFHGNIEQQSNEVTKKEEVGDNLTGRIERQGNKATKEENPRKTLFLCFLVVHNSFVVQKKRRRESSRRRVSSKKFTSNRQGSRSGRGIVPASI